MNKKLKMILFSLALVSLLSSGTTHATRTPNTAQYKNVCTDVCNLCMYHPKTTVAALVVVALLIAPSAYRSAKYTLRKIDDHRKKLFVLALIVMACWAVRWSDRHWNKNEEKATEGRIVQCILKNWENLWNQSIKGSRPGLFVGKKLNSADAKVLEFLNWSSGYMIRVIDWLGLHNIQKVPYDSDQGGLGPDVPYGQGYGEGPTGRASII